MNNKNKVNTGFTLNNDIISIMDEYLIKIGNTNRSRYIEKLIKEDLEKRGIVVPENNKKAIKLDLNSILDKLSTFGFSSLSEEEKEFLEKS